jgi:hypothetical protein
MRLALLLALAIPLKGVSAQPPLFSADALAQLYGGYDAGAQTAQWKCTAEQQSRGMHSGWSCVGEGATVSITALLLAQVPEGASLKTYLIASAKPAYDPYGYDCHACQTAIGAAEFTLQGGKWTLEAANPAIGFYGGWGESPGVALVQAGEHKHGVLLCATDSGMGFISSSKVLLLPIGKSVTEVWSLDDEEDDLGAVDPADRQNPAAPHRSSAAFRFLAGEETANSDNTSEYYDIEVISRGDNHDDFSHPTKTQDWTAIYRFSYGRYKLFRRSEFLERREPSK